MRIGRGESRKHGGLPFRHRGWEGVRAVMWRFKEFTAEYLVPAAMGVIGAFIGIGLAHWLGIM